ncbi:MAG TPA: sulfatase, partial [Gemmataceae bacterium]|nr:sulfatase [Gemmataceae bacterium]
MKPRTRLGIESLEDRLVPAGQPNILFIMADDLDVESVRHMPRVQELLADQGVTFENSFVTSPLCAPTNATILTGQYNYNHGVINNLYPSGGFQKFLESGGEQSTLATWLQDAGYHTARVGKYLIEYPIDSTYIPPGWNDWYSTGSFGGARYLDYMVNDNGQLVQFGSAPEDYVTDVLTAKVVDLIDQAEANDAQPFFVQLTPGAPHGDRARNGPPVPAPRHVGMFAGVQAPRTPSFNEADVSDKPPSIRNLPLLTDAQIAAIDHEYRTRLEALQSLDEGIGRIIDTLVARGELDNTYIVYTS